jgi:malignant T-cell-amplified sequence
MFKKFSLDEFHGSTQIKSSAQRSIRQKIAEQFPNLSHKKKEKNSRQKESSDEEDEDEDDDDDEDKEHALTALDLILPKKSEIRTGRLENKILIVLCNNEPLFFQVQRDGPYYPTLFVLHRYPKMMKRLRVDSGAIKYVFKGSNIMCPGITNANATIHDECEVGEPVAIYAQGKEHALAVGCCAMSTEAMRAENKGIGVELCHHLSDGLWAHLSKFHGDE